MSALYCDGGVIDRNPSPVGGTWAFCLVAEGLRVSEGSGVITPLEAELPGITNNLTEMLAVVRGLQSLPFIWRGVVLSDSQITLGRVFMGWKWKNIPAWLHQEFQVERKRLVNWERIRYTLLQGHPTRAELGAGVGSRGYPVSEFNVWCDHECGRQAEAYRQQVGLLSNPGANIQASPYYPGKMACSVKG